MKRLLLLFFFFPFLLIGQECDTIYPSQYPDTIFYCVTDASCYGACDGELEINIFGPNAPYRFIIGTSSDTLPNGTLIDTLCPFGYSILVLDNNNNNVDVIFTAIASPSEILIYADDVVGPNCFGEDDGFINISTFGDSPFTWSWNNGYITEDISGLESGTYVVTTTDSNGCSRIDPFPLSNPAKVNSTTITDTLSCIGLCDGEAIVIPSDGVGPYTYQWLDINGDTIIGETNDITTDVLCYGISTVLITDSMGCLDTNEVFIANPDTLKLSNITIDNACYQICDGEISVTIEGGTGPYDTEWSLGGNIFNTTDTITEDTLCPGNYQLIFTDAIGCDSTVIITLIERDSFEVVTLIKINDSCYNSCTGQLAVELSNQDNPPFNYFWEDTQGQVIQNDTISNLCSDTFELVIVDDRQCRDTFEFIIYEPDSLSYDAIEVTHNPCYGDSMGTITVINLTGGINPITYSWSSGDTSIIPGISSLVAGFYDLHIEDANECAIPVANIQVTQPPILTVSYDTTEASCFGYSDGSITVSISGGTVPYKLNNVLLSANDTIISNLAAGQYLYTILDSNNCPRSEDTITVGEPAVLEIDTILTQVPCHGDSTGSIALTITGGTAAYSYSWSNSDTTQDLLNIGAGTYTVLVADNQGCTESGTYIITEPQFPINSDIVGTDILCNGDNTGSADLIVAGGTFPYSYLWSNAETTEDIDTLIAGTYDVRISDSNNCLHFDTIIIIESALISTSINIDSVLCNGDSTGSVDLTVSGGVSPYTYLWNTGDITQNLDSIPAGTYSVTVTDINLCAETFSLNVSEPSELVSLLTNTNIDCYGNNNGSIDLAPSGGVGNFSFFWSNNESTEDINNLDTGTYLVELSDGNGCIIFDSATITEPTELIITSSFENSICNGAATGSIDITVAGGTGALSYLWSNGSNFEDLNNIPAGNYTVDVTDANGCQESEFFVINQPSPFSVADNVTHVVDTCNGAATGSIDFFVVGNTFPYTYLWSNNATSASIANLTAGNYTVDVTDDNDCEITYSYLITEPDALLLDYTIKPASCEEKDDGAIYASATGGTLPISYDWSNGEEGQDILDLSKGVYSLQVEDANGCTLPLETIEVNFDGFDGCIEIPSGFTPNGDGIHDEWSIYGLYHFPDVLVKIFNRWGQQVFESDGYDVPWDGKHNGKDLPIATYYYVIELMDSAKMFNGIVTIKR